MLWDFRSSSATSGYADCECEFKISDGFTPLLCAVSYENEDESLRMIQLLLQRDAHFGAKDIDGSTELHYAAARGHSSVVELLLDQDVHHPDSMNNDRETP